MKLTPSIALVLGFLLFISQSYAAKTAELKRPPIRIDHLNIDYNNKVGSGEVQLLSYHVDEHFSLEHARLKADVTMKENTLTITDGTTKFSIHQILNFINLFDSIRAEDLNFFLENSHFVGSIPHSYVGLTGNRFLLSQLIAECGSTDHDVAVNDDTLVLILEMCMSKAHVNLAEMTFPETSPFRNVFEKVITEVFPQKMNAKVKLDRIKDFTLNFLNHDFDAHAKVRVLIDFGVSIAGHVAYEPEKARYKIELTHARVAFVGIRRIIFNVLKRLNDPMITVAEPNIFVNYVSSGKAPVANAISVAK